MVVRDVFHIDGFVKVSVLVSSAPPTQLFGGNGHPTAAQQIVHCFALRDCSGVFTTLFGRGRRGGRGGGRGGGGRGRGEGRVGTKLLLFQCSQSSTFRHFDVLAWHVSQFVWVQCRETVLAGAHLRWGRKRGARKMEKKILGRILEQTFKNLRTEWIGVGSVYTAICAGFRPLVVWCGAVENLDLWMLCGFLQNFYRLPAARKGQKGTQ